MLIYSPLNLEMNFFSTSKYVQFNVLDFNFLADLFSKFCHHGAIS